MIIIIGILYSLLRQRQYGMRDNVRDPGIE
jgi:hypothetical protein